MWGALTPLFPAVLLVQFTVDQAVCQTDRGKTQRRKDYEVTEKDWFHTFVVRMPQMRLDVLRAHGL